MNLINARDTDGMLFYIYFFICFLCIIHYYKLVQQYLNL